MRGRQSRQCVSTARRSRAVCRVNLTNSTTKQKHLLARTFLRGRQSRRCVSTVRRSRAVCRANLANSTTKQKRLLARTFLRGRQSRQCVSTVRRSRAVCRANLAVIIIPQFKCDVKSYTEILPCFFHFLRLFLHLFSYAYTNKTIFFKTEEKP